MSTLIVMQQRSMALPTFDARELRLEEVEIGRGGIGNGYVGCSENIFGGYLDLKS